MDIFETFRQTWEDFAARLSESLPLFIAAVLIIIVGGLLASLFRRLMIWLLQLCHFDHAAEKAGISRMLERGEVRQRPSELLSLLVSSFLFLIIVIAALNVAGLPGVSDILKAVLLYIPHVVAAIVVLILGFYFANFLEAVVRATCANAGVAHAEGIARGGKYATLVFVSLGILEILGIASEIVSEAFILFFGAVCLALALAFGLGGKDVAARYLTRWLEKEKTEDRERREE
jgi:hypothetical protein